MAIEASAMITKSINDDQSLPPGWKLISLAELCTEIIGGGTPSRHHDEYFGGDIVWITPSDLDASKPVQEIFTSQVKITSAGLNDSSAKIVPVGTVLFSSRATIGKIAIAGVPLSTNQGFVNFVCKNEQVNNHYLAWCLRSLTEEIRKLAGSTTYLEVSRGDLRRFKIPIPFPNDPLQSLDIQHRIVSRIEAHLADLDEARKTLRDVMKRNLDQVMEALLTEIFDKSTMQHWPNRASLGKLVAIFARQVNPQHTDYKHLPHIGGESIESGTSRLGSYKTAEEDKVISSNYLFDSGVILYSKIRPYLRKAVLVDFKGLCSADIYPLTVISNELFPRFLMWTLVAPPFTDFAIAKSGRARMPKINREELFSYELPFPDWNEQQRIVNLIDSTQIEVEKMQNTLADNDELLKQVEQAILHEAFRGEL